MNKLILPVFKCLLATAMVSCTSQPAQLENCQPTPFDEIGPFYRPGSPVRDKVGAGYILSGQVLSTEGCTPLAGSRIEFWLVNPQGEYDDAHRATVYADKKGFYSFECNRPAGYVTRLPHIHMMITAEGHEQLITQHYPKENQGGAEFNLVVPLVQL